MELSSLFQKVPKNRKERNRLRVIKSLTKSSNPLTIFEISHALDLSIPSVTNIINELMEKGVVVKNEKRISKGGRKPFTYSPKPSALYIIGVEILSRFIHVSITQIDLKVAYEQVNRSFVLNNSHSCLQTITSFIEQTIQESAISKQKIIGVGVGLSSYINNSGIFFNTDKHEYKITLEKYLHQKLELPVFVDQDTRTIAVAEQILGDAGQQNNVVVIKMSRKVGMSLIINQSIVRGENGLSGNLAHTQFNKGIIPCNCGKIGCLGTLLGGDALIRDLKQKIAQGCQSLHFKKEQIDSYTYHDIIEATDSNDELSIELVQKQGNILGRALGNIINILNPKMIIISGEYVALKNHLIESVKIGAQQTALPDNLSQCEVRISSLDRFLSSKAGVCYLLKKYDLK